MPVTSLTIPQRVTKGISLLDEVKPDWRNEIRLDDLEMQNSRDCVLGQVFGDYFNFTEGPLALGRSGGWGYVQSIKHGFLPNTPGDDGEYEDLREEWVNQIKASTTTEVCPSCHGNRVIFVCRNSRGEIDYIDGLPTNETTECPSCDGTGEVES